MTQFSVQGVYNSLKKTILQSVVKKSWKTWDYSFVIRKITNSVPELFLNGNLLLGVSWIVLYLQHVCSIHWGQTFLLAVFLCCIFKGKENDREELDEHTWLAYLLFGRRRKTVFHSYSPSVSRTFRSTGSKTILFGVSPVLFALTWK